ncbi:MULTISPECIES: GNAT family N-acetyltransferase [unclassified Kribbella]|uniref:GNAT family N-acetyltransferase n=1 Tax=unclassified Kribbella TaxID=2644121 RepID=UPI0030184432
MIRPATDPDAETVTAIAQASFEHYIPRIGGPPVPMLLDYRAAIAGGKVWVATGADEITGFVLLEDEPDSLLLDVLAVAPTAQGRGIGSALLDFVEAEARARGYEQVTLCTNAAMTENLAYYPRRGYVETHRATVNDRHRVFFRKELMS